MNKAGLITNVADITGMDRANAEIAVNAVFDVIQNTLENGERVQLIGFGSFEVRDRKSRQGRNPRNPGETIDIPASKAAVFKAGKSLKEAVNK